MARVTCFISHAHGESELAALLKARLVQDFIGLLDIFVSSDFKSIGAGEDWYSAIMSAVRAADIHLVLCSQDSITSPWINIELGAALCRQERKILPVCHTNLRWKDFRVRPLADKQGFDAGTTDGLAYLYATVAGVLGSAVPRVDFGALAVTINEIEARYLEAKTTKAQSVDCPTPINLQVMLPKPRVLCVTSVRFHEVVRKDLDLILAAFPPGTHHEIVADPTVLKELMAREKFDIVHVANETCPVTGNLIFTSLAPEERSAETPLELLPAAIFARLVEECGAALVVLANNETLPLLVKVLPVTSVAFAEEPVDIPMLIAWLQTFYSLLSGGFSLSEACRKTYAQHQIPVRLYPKLFTEAAAVSSR
ncbi:MAG: toll/interleukin-1 receptor domain-containing protein [Candidatus Solibacter sp.]